MGPLGWDGKGRVRERGLFSPRKPLCSCGSALEPEPVNRAWHRHCSRGEGRGDTLPCPSSWLGAGSCVGRSAHSLRLRQELGPPPQHPPPPGPPSSPSPLPPAGLAWPEQGSASGRCSLTVAAPRSSEPQQDRSTSPPGVGAIGSRMLGCSKSPVFCCSLNASKDLPGGTDTGDRAVAAQSRSHSCRCSPGLIVSRRGRQEGQRLPGTKKGENPPFEEQTHGQVTSGQGREGAPRQQEPRGWRRQVQRGGTGGAASRGAAAPARSRCVLRAGRLFKRCSQTAARSLQGRRWSNLRSATLNILVSAGKVTAGACSGSPGGSHQGFVIRRCMSVVTHVLAHNRGLGSS